MEYADLLLMADFDSNQSRKSITNPWLGLPQTEELRIDEHQRAVYHISSFNSHWGIGWMVHKSE